MKKFIILGSFSVYLILPIISGILEKIIDDLFSILGVSLHPVFDVLTTGLFLVFSFIPVIISFKLNKKKNEVSFNDPYTRSKCHIIFLLIGIAFLFDFTILIESSLEKEVSPHQSFWALQIVFLSYFSKIILKRRIYKHQWISTSFIAAFSLILVIKDFIIYFEEIKKDYIRIFFNILNEILFGLFFVLINYILIKGIFLPYTLLMLLGIIISLINLLVIYISGMFSCSGKLLEEGICLAEYHGKFYFDHLLSSFDDIKEIYYGISIKLENYYSGGIYVFFCILYLVVVFAYDSLHIFIIDKLSPCHHLIRVAIYHIIYEISEIIELVKSEKGFSIGSQILYWIYIFFVLFFILVYTEIIELNFWKLNYNTRRNIIAREEDEDRIISFGNEIQEEMGDNINKNQKNKEGKDSKKMEMINYEGYLINAAPLMDNMDSDD